MDGWLPHATQLGCLLRSLTLVNLPLSVSTISIFWLDTEPTPVKPQQHKIDTLISKIPS